MLHRCNVLEWEWEGMGKALWESHMGMGIGYKFGNVNGKECESIAREWEEVGM